MRRDLKSTEAYRKTITVRAESMQREAWCNKLSCDLRSAMKLAHTNNPSADLQKLSACITLHLLYAS